MTHLQTLAPLLGIVARERTASRPDLYDDARQEGLIRAWTVEEGRPDAPREYVLAAAKRGIGDVVRGRPLTGQEGRRGWQDAADSAGPLFRVTDKGEDLEVDPEDPVAAEAMDRAELTPHLAEIRAAVNALPEEDRRIVALRFTSGLDWPTVAARLDKKTEAVRRRFVQHIAPRLRDDLAHLASLA